VVTPVTHSPGIPGLNEQFGAAQRSHQQDDLDAAEKQYAAILKVDPDHADSVHFLGVLHHQRDDHKTALALIERSIQLAPERMAYYSNYAMALEHAGRLEDAVEAELPVLAHDMPEDAALATIASRLMQLKSPRASHRAQAAIKSNPRNTIALKTLGELLIRDRSYVPAIDYLQQAVAIDQHDAETWNLLGNAYKMANQHDDAVSAYEAAIEIDPACTYFYSNLADLYEIFNEPDNAAAVLQRAIQLSPDDPYILFIAAKCDERNGDYQAALAKLIRVDRSKIIDDVVMSVAFLIGRLQDALGQYDDAFLSFSNGNQLLKKRAYGAEVSKGFRQKIVDLNTMVTPQWAARIKPTAAAQAPVFLVGFPRSGTTLIERVLDSHSRIQSLDEKPIIAALIEQVATSTSAFVEALPVMREHQVHALRKIYFETANQYVDNQPNGVILDKFPLNVVNVPMIYRLFPDAKIIFVLRHPCDACLSCFMQSFEPNAAMDNFYTLADTVRLYCQVMRLWETLERTLPLNVHYIRYEDLVAGFSSRVSEMLAFLDLPFEDGTRDFVMSARGKRISTPSYRQVSQPIYTRATYRWQHYDNYLAPYLRQLQPYIERFGYTDSGPDHR
jgi:Flp pilus assembly protein TadD